MTFEVLLENVYEITAILQPKEHQVFDFSMKRIIHNEMLDYYSEKNWNRVITHCRELKGEFGGKLDYYYYNVIERAIDFKLQELLEES